MREHLENHLRGDVLLVPLEVGTPVAAEAAERDHRIGRGTNLGLALDRIPEKVARDEDIGPVAEEDGKALLDRDDPAELEGVLGHRLPVGLRVDDLLTRGRRDRDRAHRGAPLGARPKAFLHSIPYKCTGRRLAGRRIASQEAGRSQAAGRPDRANDELGATRRATRRARSQITAQAITNGVLGRFRIVGLFFSKRKWPANMKA